MKQIFEKLFKELEDILAKILSSSGELLKVSSIMLLKLWPSFESFLFSFGVDVIEFAWLELGSQVK